MCGRAESETASYLPKWDRSGKLQSTKLLAEAASSSLQPSPRRQMSQTQSSLRKLKSSLSARPVHPAKSMPGAHSARSPRRLAPIPTAPKHVARSPSPAAANDPSVANELLKPPSSPEVFRQLYADRADAFFRQAQEDFLAAANNNQTPELAVPAPDVATVIEVQRDAQALRANVERNRAKQAKHAERRSRRRLQETDGDSEADPEREPSLHTQWASVWQEERSPAWGKRSSPSWGGVGWHYAVTDGSPAALRPGWGSHQTARQQAFDERMRRFADDVGRLHSQGSCLVSIAPTHVHEIDQMLLGLRAHRYPVQPMRLTTPLISPRGSSFRLAAIEAYAKPLALSSASGGGPLVPVFERVLAADDKVEEEAEVRFVPAWTLYNSIWGPRCEWCDGRDFTDHAEVEFERFTSDWQLMLRFGLGKTIIDFDADGKGDEDGDGVPDEVEDVCALLREYHPLLLRVYAWYADAIYGSGDDLDIGIKQNDGFKACADDIGIWSHLSIKDAAAKNSLIFMGVDKVDTDTIGAIAKQSTFRGRLRGAKARSSSEGGQPPSAPLEHLNEADFAKVVENGLFSASQSAMAALADPELAFRSRPTRQLLRAEFFNALVKLAIERWVKSKQNPKNEIDDVSDAVHRLLVDHIVPALGEPLAGSTQPKLPPPDEFRRLTCYRQDVSEMLAARAPSLRVIFAGLARLTFESSRGTPTPLPKGHKNRKVVREGAEWIVVPGYVSFFYWHAFCAALDLYRFDLREVTRTFLYSVMAVIDDQSAEGRIKERHLPFEGFLEALVRVATVVPLPMDDHLKIADFSSAGAFMAHLQSTNDELLEAMDTQQHCEWGGVPQAAVAGEMPRRLDHLIDIILRKVKELETSDQPLTVLTRREFRLWAVRRVGVQAEISKGLPETWLKDAQLGEHH